MIIREKVKKCFKLGVKNFTAMYPRMLKTSNPLVMELMEICDVNSYCALQNYVGGKSPMSRKQVEQVRKAFWRYNIDEVFDDEEVSENAIK